MSPNVPQMDCIYFSHVQYILESHKNLGVWKYIKPV